MREFQTLIIEGLERCGDGGGGNGGGDDGMVWQLMDLA
jgi:hypothetical protein